MDPYIQARLERAEHYFNTALSHSKGETGCLSSSGWTHEHIMGCAIQASLTEFKKIEKYIHQCGAQTKEDAQYHSVIE